MRPLAALAVVLIVGAACSGEPEGSGDATTESSPATSPQASTTPMTPPEPATHNTFVVDEGLLDPIAVPGEPRRSLDDPVTGDFETVLLTLVIEVPPDWSSRGLTLSNWTPGIGFYGPTYRFFPEIEARTHGPDFVYELWLMDDIEGDPVRRLIQLDARELDGPLSLRFADGYTDVNDVLTRQPPAGGSTSSTSVVGVQACADYGTWFNSTGTGLLIVVTTSQVDRAEIYDGQWIDLPLEDSAEGHRFAVLDLDSPEGPDGATTAGPLRFFDGDGREFTCAD